MKTFFFLLEIAISAKPLPPQIFAFPSKISVLARCLLRQEDTVYAIAYIRNIKAVNFSDFLNQTVIALKVLYVVTSTPFL